MSFLEILDTVLLKPLELIFEVVYIMANKVIGNPGLTIVVLSLFMNFLVLPLYIRADALQEEEHALEKKLQKGVDHIKKTFRGDERMMILQTYYRQNHYKPVYVLRSAVSLFLQIPFFIAAYRFLSTLQLLEGAPFGPIMDLCRPDGLLQIGGIHFNVLPVIMTAVNLISCIIFTKGSPLKAKIQLYAMALFFLVFLYGSPSGLVFYWTLNNVFSLVKTVFYKLKDPGKAVRYLISAAGILLAIYGAFFYHFWYNILIRKMLLVGVGILLQAPLLYGVMKGRRKRKKAKACAAENRKLFFSGALFLTVLTGALIPSAVIGASPQEFVNLTSFCHPLWYIVSSFCMAAGLFVLWAGVFYYLAKPSVRVYFDRAVWILSGIAIVDYMFFGKNLGLLDPHLKFEIELQYSRKEMLTNIAVVLAAALVLSMIYRRWRRFSAEVLLVGALACSVMVAVNAAGISNSIDSMDISIAGMPEEEMPGFTLSRTGENVIVLMLDRAIGAYIPYIFHEKPELEEKFSGFTYYANMVSFGGYTIFGVPPLFGGYEYTPVEMNKRNEELLIDKHNEALKVMPVLFSENGYEVTVCDAPYAGYQWVPDMSIYDDYPEINKYVTNGKYDDPIFAEQEIKNNKRNFFCYGIFKAVPVCFQKLVYDKGGYNQAELEVSYTGQWRGDSLCTAKGMEQRFMSAYNVLEALPEMTEIEEGKKDTFLMMTNDSTHELMLLQEPDYVPKMRVDNTEYAKEYAERFTLDGQTLKMETDIQVIHYHTNMAALLKLGEWFDYMREEGVYDNTKIIIVSDHGRNLEQLDELMLEDGFDIESRYSLLMVKDFGSEGFSTSEEFMTCADVPAIATEGTIEDAVNPFTGKRLGYGDKAVNPQYILDSEASSVAENNGTQYMPAKWYAVQDDMRKPENWKLVAEDAVLPSED